MPAPKLDKVEKKGPVILCCWCCRYRRAFLACRNCRAWRRIRGDPADGDPDYKFCTRRSPTTLFTPPAQTGTHDGRVHSDILTTYPITHSSDGCFEGIPKMTSFPRFIQLLDAAGVRYRVLRDDVERCELTLEPVAGGPPRTATYADVMGGHYRPDCDDDLLEG